MNCYSLVVSILVWKTIIVTRAIVLERNYSSQQTEGNKRGQQGQKPTLYSVAELVLGFKTAGILHQPFPPADNTQTVE
jgi:hypothetical protein